MKITKSYLRTIIKEEIEAEGLLDAPTSFSAASSHGLDLKKMIINKYHSLQKEKNGHVTADDIVDMFYQFYNTLQRLSQHKKART